MLFGLVYSAQDIKNRISTYSLENPLEGENLVETLTKKIWGNTQPWFDLFFGLFGWSRTNRVQSALNALNTERERKIQLLNPVEDLIQEFRDQGKTPQQITNLLAQFTEFSIFSRRELEWLSIVPIEPTDRPKNAATWGTWKQQTANTPLNTVNQLSKAPFQTVAARIESIEEAMEKGDLEALSPEEKTAIVSAVFMEHFYGSATLFFPFLLPHLARIKQTAAFLELFKTLVRAHYPTVFEEAKNVGAGIQERAKDPEAPHNQRENGLLHLLSREQPTFPFNVVFHRRGEKKKSDPVNPGKNPSRFVAQIHRFSDKTTQFRILLQRLLHQYAYTKPTQAMADAIRTAFPDAKISAGGDDLQSLRADVYEMSAHEVLVRYTYHAHVTTDEKSRLKDFKLTTQFFYQLTRTSSGWQVQGPFYSLPEKR